MSLIIYDNAKQTEFTNEVLQTIEDRENIMKAKRRSPVRQKPIFNNRKVIVDNRVSVCSECRRGIFKETKYSWTRKGLVHDACKDDNEIEFVEGALHS